MTVSPYLDRRILVLFLAGISSGLPLFLVGKCLQAWMTTEGLSDVAIGYVGLVALPYSLKFLWSPLLDRLVPPGGRRRGWLGLMACGLCLALAAMARGAPEGDLTLLMGTAVLVALLSATQDVAVDALRVESLPPEAQGAGAAAGVLGYRLALLLTGGLGFILADHLSWPTTYLIMAALQAVGVLAAMLVREPVSCAPPVGWVASVVEPLRDYHQRRGWRMALIIAAFAIFYKLGDALAGSLATTFVLRSGFSATELGSVQGTVGLAATAFGVVAGGAALLRYGLLPCLMVFGIAQALSNLAYAGLAAWGGGVPGLMMVLTIENLTAGLGTAAFVAFLSQECSPAFAATQYALLSSLVAAGRDVLASSAGACKATYQLDWTGFFIFTTVAAVPGLLLLFLVRGDQRGAPSSVHHEYP